MSITNRLLIFFLIFSLITLSCKKDLEDETAPTIIITSPNTNAVFDVGDTMTIVAHIEDNKLVSSIKVSILNQDRLEVLTSRNFTGNANTFNLNTKIIIDNQNIESGLYYICVVASDGINTKNQFLEIHITGKPKKLLGIVYISDQGNNVLHIRNYDTTSTDNLMLSISGDYSCSELNSKYQKLFVAGARFGKLNAINLTDNNIDWSVDNESNNTQPWFYQLYFNSNTIYCATQNGVVSGYSMNGIRTALYSIGTNWHAKNMLESEGRFFAEVENQTNVYPQLAQFYNSSHVFISQQIMNFNGVKIFPQASESIYVFGNTNNIGNIYLYNFLLQSFSLLHNVDNETIIDVAMVSSRQFLVLTTNGVYWFNNQQLNSLVQLCIFQGGQQLLYDDLSNSYFVVKSNQITQYTFPNGLLQNTFPTTETITKAHLYYSR
ncbi:MAG: DUF4625 domain-containing protein [Bacteroidota bacterium]